MHWQSGISWNAEQQTPDNRLGYTDRSRCACRRVRSHVCGTSTVFQPQPKKTAGLIYFAFDLLWLLSWHYSFGRHRSRASDARKDLRIGWDVRSSARDCRSTGRAMSFHGRMARVPGRPHNRLATVILADSIGYEVSLYAPTGLLRSNQKALSLPIIARFSCARRYQAREGSAKVAPLSPRSR